MSEPVAQHGGSIFLQPAQAHRPLRTGRAVALTAAVEPGEGSSLSRRTDKALSWLGARYVMFEVGFAQENALISAIALI